MAQSNPYPWQVARGDGIALRCPSRHGAEEDGIPLRIVIITHPIPHPKQNFSMYRVSPKKVYNKQK